MGGEGELSIYELHFILFQSLLVPQKRWQLSVFAYHCCCFANIKALACCQQMVRPRLLVIAFFLILQVQPGKKNCKVKKRLTLLDCCQCLLRFLEKGKNTFFLVKQK